MASKDVEAAQETTPLIPQALSPRKSPRPYATPRSYSETIPKQVTEQAIGNKTFQIDEFQRKYELAKESSGIPKKHLEAGAVALCLIVFGIAGGHFLEQWSYLTSCYVIVQIITTIGYGDLTVHGKWTKALMAVYCLLVMVLGGYYLNLFAQKVSESSMNRARERLQKVAIPVEDDVQAMNTLSAESVSPTWRERVALKRLRMPAFPSLLERFNAANAQVVAAGLWFAAYVVFGTVFYRLYEHCSCSYGQSFVVGCREPDFETCQETGGHVKTWQATFYMSIVTLLSIGFGDHAPKSWWGRLVGCIWMLTGVARTAHFVGAISEWFFNKKEEQDFSDAVNVCSEKFAEIDRDGSGKLSRGEFLSFMLVQHNLVPQDMVDQLNGLFDDLERLDGDSDGAISLDDLKGVLAVHSADSIASMN